MSAVPPLLFDSSGPVATPPATLRAALLTIAEQEAPGLTANLPGSLVEDMASTATAGLAVIDQTRVDSVNSVSPYAANAYILAQQGLQFGVPQGVNANGSAYVVFHGSAGYVIPPGFTVSNGTYQFVVQDGGTIATNGYSQSLYVVSTNSSTFAIPPNTITQIITSVPNPYSLTVTNPSDGVPALSSETTQSYRSRMLTASQVAISGTQTYLKTLLLQVPGVSSRLVSVRIIGSNWEVICGGGDPYQVAGAIYSGVSTVALLTGSPISSGRNVNVTLIDTPDTYEVVYVNPPQQNVGCAIVWNTNALNFTAASAVNQTMVQTGQSYFNGILVGQPINLLVLQEQLQASVASILPAVNLTTLQFSITINGIPVEPSAGTSIIPSDPESSFYASPTSVTSAQG